MIFCMNNIFSDLAVNIARMIGYNNEEYMISPRITISIFVLLSLFSFPALSQVQISQNLSLQDAVLLALKNNPELTTARLEVDRSDARVTEAWGNALPSIDFTSTYTRTLKRPVFFAEFGGALTTIQIGSEHSLDMAFTGRQVLFNGAVIAGVGAAHVYSTLARDLYTSKKLDIITKARKDYYTTLLAREVVKMMKTSLQNAEENLQNVQLLRRQGIVSEYDELRASVQVENLRPSVIQSDNNYQLSLDALRNTLGLEKTVEIYPSDTLEFHAVDDAIIRDAENQLLVKNPNLQAISRQIQLNEAAVSAERSGYLPTLAAFGQYQYQAANSKFNFSTNDLISSSAVGLSLSFNIFQGLQTRAKVEQAQLEQRKSEEQKSGLERSLKTGLHSILGNLNQARLRIQAQEKTVETAERGYSIVTARFLANAATQLEVNDAESALTQAKVNRIQAIYDYLSAAADLDQLIARVPPYVQ